MEKIIVALEIMGKGMLGIFVSLAFVYLFIAILNKAFPEKKPDIKEQKENRD